MHEAQASRTAFRVAVRRAAHQVLDTPRVFDDPLAVAIIGAEAASQLASGTSLRGQLAARPLRAFMAVRSRYAEDELARAVQDGVRQYGILGAGLDTFAYRNPHRAAGLRVLEIDHPATQEWKRDQLRTAGITIPPEVVFAAVDFERQSLAYGLETAGFHRDEPAFFSWLGVVPYLTDRAFGDTLAFLAALPAGSGVVFDYSVARSSLKFAERLALDALSARVAAVGEPFQLFFEPQQLAERLRRAGFRQIEDLGPDEINARYFSRRADGL